ncbi:Bacteroides conjugative transposon TraM protein [Chryseobacterium rhizoplanae]|uniref:Bacteroides conjugative transposon TraM protein n=1 Tax=Chryseobacterium rhizoplanae TaxID=1609531 RepID=A0A521DJW6_9FLAO|nr:conjugative transposon protein TraM [Chryseobacterium rhizoplanae]SMO72009.1 Bacteroides conjugative transposon TraM protein [Chryseobacterium rhizoplanae]
MRDSNKIKITEGGSPETENESNSVKKLKWERAKKPVIYFLMTMVCACCFYLIFRPKESEIIEDSGFNTGIPQAKGDQLQSDKQKAYEQELLEKKSEEKKNAMATLSDYWTDQINVHSNGKPARVSDNTGGHSYSDRNALNSYRDVQSTLHSFYQKDDQQVNHLKKEISRLKNEALQNNHPSTAFGINDQLALMEKSYQMAAKYLPASSKSEEHTGKVQEDKKPEEKQIFITSAKPVRRNIVSSLYRALYDSSFVAGLYHNRFEGIQNDSDRQFHSKNAIKGIIHETKVLTNESTILIRLSEAMIIGQTEIPARTLLTASGKFQGGRLQLKISSIEYKENIYPVEINIHDNDGQPGVYIPYSPEQNAVNDIVAHMSQSSGTNIMMTQSAGQQISADLSRGVVQGLSGYFQKRVRQSKVLAKAGHQVFLVSKNN